jgi:hypothetical protein
MRSKDTKYSLSTDELELLSDPSFFIKKKQVTTKISELFGELESHYDSVCNEHASCLPEAVLKRRGKISRGENYKGLPYVILDFPATFTKEGVFAFRTLMWWGHPFSFTFHVAGIYLQQYASGLCDYLAVADENTAVCINAHQWEHHQEATNYIPVNEFLSVHKNSNDYFKNRGFMKLSKTVSLQNHEQLMLSKITERHYGRYKYC